MDTSVTPLLQRFDYFWVVFWIVMIATAGGLTIWTRRRKEKRSQSPRLYLEALQALLDHDDRRAFFRLKEVVAEDTTRVDAYLRMGELLRRRKHADRAIQIHSDLLLRSDLKPGERQRVLRALVLDYQTAGDVARATATLDDLLSRNHQNAWAADRRARLAEEQGDWDKAFAVRTSFAKAGGTVDNAETALYRVFAGDVVAADGRGHDARLVYKEALNIDARCIPAMLGIGDTYLADKRADDAVTWWTKVLETEPRAGHLVFDRLEKAYFELGQYGEVARIYETTLESDSTNLPALAKLSELAHKKGERKEAEAYCQRMLELDPDNVHARVAIIRLLADEGKVKDTVREIDALLQTLPFKTRGYHCAKCDHKSTEVVWRCPQCHALGSYPLYN